jgi:hypothetical protein
MKTKDQILAHLKSAGYKQSEISKIMGFLIGNGTKTPTEAINYRVGNGTFDDFLKWYQSEVEETDENCPICDAFHTLFAAMDSASKANDVRTLEHLDALCDQMIDLFIEDVSDYERN